MTLLKDLLALKAAAQPPVVDKQIDEARGGEDIGELVQKWMDHNKIYSMEGSRGERNFEKLIRVLGYRDMSEFLQDNSGCIEAMVEWISNMRSPEWAQSLKDDMPGGDDDEDEDDDDK